MRGTSERVFGPELRDRIGGRHDRELHLQTALRVDELRPQRTEEQPSLAKQGGTRDT